MTKQAETNRRLDWAGRLPLVSLDARGDEAYELGGMGRRLKASSIELRWLPATVALIYSDLELVAHLEMRLRSRATRGGLLEFDRWHLVKLGMRTSSTLVKSKTEHNGGFRCSTISW
jgi:hypothetical protein